MIYVKQFCDAAVKNKTILVFVDQDYFGFGNMNIKSYFL